MQIPLRRGDHAGDASAEGRNTQCAIAAAVETVFRVDLERADPDPGLLDGDDEGGEGTARRRRATLRSFTTGRAARSQPSTG